MNTALNLSEDFFVENTIKYPPFLNGLHLEEFFSKYYLDNNFSAERIFINALWTNLQLEENFKIKQSELQNEINSATNSYDKYFTVVQFDDGVLFNLPKNTLVFGACYGDIPIPLIYEDDTCFLESLPKYKYKEKNLICSFIGADSHPLRTNMYTSLKNEKGFYFNINEWTPYIINKNVKDYYFKSSRSKFVLCPRGYGRASFRFYEILKLGSIPIYVWDDIEWLPYKELIDYSKFSISLNIKEIKDLPKILSSIDELKYDKMLNEYLKVKNYFSLKGMSDYILKKVQNGC